MMAVRQATIDKVPVGVYGGQSTIDANDYIESGAAIINQNGEMRFIVGQQLLKAKLFLEGRIYTNNVDINVYDVASDASNCAENNGF